ncbi:tetratricopeptide (TPR) repeat protein [Ereboglobus sp. PH5-10]|uniref:tetratricopeptide repeat protein n=1 Tax=Ereboglobus sp. PH5-10 TaxID=2940629 RepID=UPI002406C2E2|nr:tetratricopeptide repeat protein [Ereboglobus sp. PH5-10]MDF9826184.1 tetratricopeptide (TPR) repeat protein [Ereboglobus sp. PH5-10]
MQKITSTLTALLVLFLIAGCGGGKKEVSKLHQDQAAKHASDANMENFLRNYAAAEKSLTQATTLNPTVDDYWIELGKVRVRLGDKSGATKAYKGALAACDAQLKEVAENPVFIERKLRALVMLGRDDDARKVLAKAVKNYPQNTHLKTLDQVKAVDLFKNDAHLKDFIVK